MMHSYRELSAGRGGPRETSHEEKDIADSTLYVTSILI